MDKQGLAQMMEQMLARMEASMNAIQTNADANRRIDKDEMMKKWTI
jgi:hypothetical protein